MEHHSISSPGSSSAGETGAEFLILPLTEAGDLDLEAAQRLLAPGVKLVAAAHSSNVLGTVNDIPKLAQLTHAAGGALFVDGAQGICHEPVDMRALDCDWYAFSGHKLGAPSASAPSTPAPRCLRSALAAEWWIRWAMKPPPSPPRLWAGRRAPQCLRRGGPGRGPRVPPLPSPGLAGLGRSAALPAGAGAQRPGSGAGAGRPRRRSGCLSFTVEGPPPSTWRFCWISWALRCAPATTAPTPAARSGDRVHPAGLPPPVTTPGGD